jgi:hypothetical protein
MPHAPSMHEMFFCRSKVAVDFWQRRWLLQMHRTWQDFAAIEV